MKHSLVQLADKFNWTKIDELCNAKFCKVVGNTPKNNVIQS